MNKDRDLNPDGTVPRRQTPAEKGRKLRQTMEDANRATHRARIAQDKREKARAIEVALMPDEQWQREVGRPGVKRDQSAEVVIAKMLGATPEELGQPSAGPITRRPGESTSEYIFRRMGGELDSF